MNYCVYLQKSPNPIVITLPQNQMTIFQEGSGLDRLAENLGKSRDGIGDHKTNGHIKTQKWPKMRSSKHAACYRWMKNMRSMFCSQGHGMKKYVRRLMINERKFTLRYLRHCVDMVESNLKRAHDSCKQELNRLFLSLVPPHQLSTYELRALSLRYECGKLFN